MTFLQRAIQDGHAKFIGEGKNQQILYIAANHKERFSDPEEIVRAEFWAELIYRLEYKPERIDFEVTVPRRTPSDWAALVIYHAALHPTPFAVLEPKKAGIK